MSFLVWLLLAVGSFLVYAGFKGKNPVTLVADALQGKG